MVMATVIVNRDVWNRVYEYYVNVEIKYPNTWNLNDTIKQINKIHWVISNFENLCVWSREPIISHWKSMGWKETWHKSSPWHFAFECKCVDGEDYIFIQDAEHQDDIKENLLKIKQQILENKWHKHNMYKKSRVSLTECQLNNIVKRCIRQMIEETIQEGYHVTERNTDFKWGNGKIGHSLVTLNDGLGGESRIIEDDGCYVLYQKVGDKYVPATHIYPEAFKEMKKLPNLPQR